MELYYDMLIPYMPDGVNGEDGTVTNKESLEAGRKAMIALSEFQLTGNVMALYQSVIHACKYADKDFIETVLSIPDDIKFDDTDTVGKLVDRSAKILFRSINPEKYPFDLDTFTANILMASHLVFLAIQQNSQSAKPETSDDTKEPVEEF